MQSFREQPEQAIRPVAELARGRECRACGATARRARARFCATCGCILEDNYLPADALRASYYTQQQRASRQSQQQRIAVRLRAPAPPAPATRAVGSNNAAATALAFITYSLVPYLGILFCPGAIVAGGIGLLGWHRAPERGGRRAACAGIILGLVILCLQLLLWWILYKVPQWAGQF
jgi:hypothetical protein